MKKVIIWVLVLGLLAGHAAAEMSAFYDEYYAKLVVVTKIKNDTLYCRDRDGMVWKIYHDPYDEEQIERGDIFSLLIHNTSTNIKKHKVMQLYYEGHTNGIQTFIKKMGWK